MHYIDPIGILSQMVGIDLAEGFGEKTGIQVAYGLVYFFFLGGNTALTVARHENDCW